MLLLKWKVQHTATSFPEHMAETTVGNIWLSALDDKYLSTLGDIRAIFIVWGADNVFDGLHFTPATVSRQDFICSVHNSLSSLVRGRIPSSSKANYVLILPGLLLVLWVADLYWRFVDIPCVTFSHWVMLCVITAPLSPSPRWNFTSDSIGAMGELLV